MSFTDLWERANSLATAEDAASFFAALSQSISEGDIDASQGRLLSGTAIKGLILSTFGSPAEAAQIISAHVLPVCLMAEREEAIEPNPQTFREYLFEWIEQYPDASKESLRTEVVGRILALLTQAPTKPAMWTIAAVGFRSPPIQKVLLDLSSRNDDIGNAAINCLAALSPPEKTAIELVKAVLSRITRHGFEPVAVAIQELASRRFIPAVANMLDGDNWQQIRALGLLGRIADRAPNDPLLQHEVWQQLRWRLASWRPFVATVLLASGVQACATAELIPSLVRLLRKPEADAYRILNRVRELEMPIQLLGWKAVDLKLLKAWLSPYATFAELEPSRSITVQAHVRKMAWEAALCSGIVALQDWLIAVLQTDSNLYGISELLSFASYVRLDQIPERIAKLVRERIEMKDNPGESLGARLKAIQVLRAIGSAEALDLLLESGLTFDGTSLRRIGEAVAAVAERLVASERDQVVEKLFALAEAHGGGHRRVLGMIGLQHLAALLFLRPHDFVRLAALSEDESVPAYAKVYIVSALGFAGDFNINSAIGRAVISNASKEPNEADLKYYALEALLRLDREVTQKHLFAQALNFDLKTMAPLQGTVKSFTSWQGVILAELLRRCDDFAPLGESIIKHGRGEVVHVFLRSLAQGTGLPLATGSSLARLAINRTRDVLGTRFGETDNFESIALLAPSELTKADWESVWDQWMPAVRAALAKSIGIAVSRLSTDESSRAFDLLTLLIGDSSYQVRRAASRAFAKVDYDRFMGLAQRWMASGSASLRQRAAEMAQWLRVTNVKALDNLAIRLLQHDPEPSVRAAAERSQKNLRYRTWQSQYLRRLRISPGVDGNAFVSRGFRYGIALMRIGDDEALEDIQRLSVKRDIPLNVQNWLSSVAEGIENHWRDISQKWPEHSLPWSGQLEEMEGVLIAGGKRTPKHFSLWQQRPEHPSQTSSWGGTFEIASDMEAFSMFGRSAHVNIQLHNRPEARVLLSSTGNRRVIFVGTGPYPET